MFNYLQDKIFDEKNHIAYGFAYVSGWAISFFAIDDNGLYALVSWETLLKTLFGMALSTITLFGGMIATDIYKYAKPKAIKFFKTKILKIGKKDKQKRA